MKKRMSADRIYLFVTGILIQIVLLLPWIPLGSKLHNTYGYFLHLRGAGNMNALMQKDLITAGLGGMEGPGVQSVAFVFMAQLILMIIVQLVGLINLMLVLFIEKRTILPVLNLVFSAANILCITEGPAYYLGDISFMLYPLVILILQAVHLIGYRMLDSWTEATEEVRQIKERERQAKKERKERLAFDGKYSHLFYQVIWKNFKSNWETYRIFVVTGTVSVSFIFAGVGMREMLSGMQGVESLIKGQGLGTILVNFLAAAIVISVFLIASVLMFYLKNHMNSYQLFQNLGIRSKTLYLFLATELFGCILVSLIGGFLLGNVILLLGRMMIQRGISSSAVLESITIKSYLLTILVSFFVYLISAMATHDIYLEKGGASARYKDVQKEKMPGKLSPVFLALGAGMIIYAVYEYAQREKAEGIPSLVFLMIGLYLFMKHFWNLYLRKRKKNEKVYLESLVKKNYFYHHFKTAFRYLFVITTLHICVLFIFSREAASSGIAETAETMFPYDYVCMATSDEEEYFDEIAKENDADILICPMVRVTNVDNSTDLNGAMEIMQPQGQQIGISESTYRMLCEKIGKKPNKLDLADDGSEIYIIFQEDKSVKAHPIDYYMGTKMPFLHIGQPVLHYDYKKRGAIYPQRKIAGIERSSLIGNLRQGEHENVIVFSDTYFEKVHELWKTTNCLNGEPIAEEEGIEDVTVHHWPDRLVLINADENEKPVIEEKLQKFAENHKYDVKFDSEVQSWYSKDEIVDQRKAGRFMSIAVSLFIIVILTLVTLVLLYMKAESEMKEKVRQQEFLKNMGMREKERLRMIRSEVQFYLWIPIAVSTAVSVIYTLILWNIRLYTPADCIAYMKIYTLIYLFYVAVQILGINGLYRFIVRKCSR